MELSFQENSVSIGLNFFSLDLDPIGMCPDSITMHASMFQQVICLAHVCLSVFCHTHTHTLTFHPM